MILFRVLAALSTLFEILDIHWGMGRMAIGATAPHPLSDLLLTAASLLLILLPNHKGAYALFAFLQSWHFLSPLPFTDQITNHSFIFALLNVAWLATAAFDLYKPGILEKNEKQIFQTGLLCLYFFAGFHKLNSDFFNPAKSCVTYLLGNHGVRISDALTMVSIYGTIATELLLPVFLILTKTRVWAVRVAGLMHLGFAFVLEPYFSLLACGLLALFLENDFPIKNLKWRASIAVLSLLLASGIRDERIEIPMLSMGVLAFVVWLFFPKLKSPVQFHPRWIAVVVAALLVINASLPYFGFKTTLAFSMFSNLHTEAGHWNHFLVPEKIRISDALDDLVEVREVPETHLASPLVWYQNPGVRIPKLLHQQLLGEAPWYNFWRTYRPVHLNHQCSW